MSTSRNVYDKLFSHTWRGEMCTTIDIDDASLIEAVTLVGLTTKKATVENALRYLVLKHKRRKAIRDMAGLGIAGEHQLLHHDRDFHPFTEHLGLRTI